MARIQTKKKDLAASTKQKQKPDNAPKKIRFKGNLEAGSNHASSSSNVKNTISSKPSNGKESLRNAILSLGGDEEDFEFLKDVDSDTEVSTVNNIKNDVSTFNSFHFVGDAEDIGYLGTFIQGFKKLHEKFGLLKSKTQ